MHLHCILRKRAIFYVDDTFTYFRFNIVSKYGKQIANFLRNSVQLSIRQVAFWRETWETIFNRDYNYIFDGWLLSPYYYNSWLKSCQCKLRCTQIAILFCLLFYFIHILLYCLVVSIVISSLHFNQKPVNVRCSTTLKILF